MLITYAVPTPTFANHESFHLRYGWLKKAYDAVQDNPRIFVADDAPVKLGVGKNMVRSMRFWALTSKIIAPTRGVGSPDVSATNIGHKLFQDSGLDPYLENPQTLWLLHWLLFAPPCRIPVWWIIMNEFAATNVKIKDLAESIQHRVTNMSEWNTPSPNSIKKDIDVFVHTYTTERGKMSIEDYLDCPFRQMHMIRQQSSDVMRFVFGKKYGMTPDIVAFACLDFINRSDVPSKSVSVTRLATEPGGVGNIFKIGENDLDALLTDACRISNHIHMDNINGAHHIVFDDAVTASEKVLDAAYGKVNTQYARKKRVKDLLVK